MQLHWTSPYVIWKGLCDPVLEKLEDSNSGLMGVFEIKYQINMQKCIYVGSLLKNNDTNQTVFSLDPDGRFRILLEQYLNCILTDD